MATNSCTEASNQSHNGVELIQKFQMNQWIILIGSWVAYVSIYLGRLNLSIAAPLMEQNGILSGVQIGALGSCFFVTYALGQIANGYLGDKLNPKWMIMIGLIITGVSNILIGGRVGVGLIFVLWAINGYAQSMIWGPLLKILGNTYTEPKQQSKAAMILSTSAGVGSIVAILMATMNLGIGYKAIFFVPGVVILLIALISYKILPATHIQKIEKVHIPLYKVFVDKEVRKMLFPAMAHGVIKDNLNLWTPILFMTIYQIDVKEVAIYVFLIPVATFIGRIIFPYIYHKCGENEKTVAAVAFGICVFSLIPIMIGELPIWLITLLLSITALSISIINASFLTIFPLRFLESNNVASVSGVIDFVTYIGAAIGSATFGVLMTLWGYTSIMVLWIILAILSLGIIGISNHRK